MFQNKLELKQHLITNPAVVLLLHRTEIFPPRGKREAGAVT